MFGTARNATIVIITTGVAAIFLGNDQRPFSLTGHIKPGLPSLKVPAFTINHTDYNVTIVMSSTEVLEVRLKSKQEEEPLVLGTRESYQLTQTQTSTRF